MLGFSNVSTYLLLLPISFCAGLSTGYVGTGADIVFRLLWTFIAVVTSSSSEDSSPLFANQTLVAVSIVVTVASYLPLIRAFYTARCNHFRFIHALFLYPGLNLGYIIGRYAPAPFTHYVYLPYLGHFLFFVGLSLLYQQSVAEVGVDDELLKKQITDDTAQNEAQFSLDIVSAPASPEETDALNTTLSLADESPEFLSRPFLPWKVISRMDDYYLQNPAEVGRVALMGLIAGICGGIYNWDVALVLIHFLVMEVSPQQYRDTNAFLFIISLPFFVLWRCIHMSALSTSPMAVFAYSDMPLYIVAAVFCLLGVYASNIGRFAGKQDRKVFFGGYLVIAFSGLALFPAKKIPFVLGCLVAVLLTVTAMVWRTARDRNIKKQLGLGVGVNVSNV